MKIRPNLRTNGHMKKLFEYLKVLNLDDWLEPIPLRKTGLRVKIKHILTMIESFLILLEN